ncbi:hypothetical protein [Streptomyces hundungensis]|uniref:hypothetical protein n=1 Tax=Streptomyces hundungensis TaxID=1077946 RepID=UPI003403DDB3
MVKQTTTLRAAGALVVFEGAPRVRWSWKSAACWTPVGLWPEPGDRAEVRERLRDGEPVLIVFAEREGGVPVTREELSGAPDAIRRLARMDDAEDLGELLVPPLDWLPQDMRRRGLRFFEQSSAEIAGTPRAIRGPVLLEPAPKDHRQLRFARATGPSGCLERDLPALVEHAFAHHRAAVGQHAA